MEEFMNLEKKEKEINNLCKKYFMPHLCENTVTETKATLESKLCKELIILGRLIWNKKSYKKILNLDKTTDPIKNDAENEISSAMEDAIYEAIALCFKEWKNQKSITSYVAYFNVVVSNEFIKAVNKDIIQFSEVSGLEKKIKEVKTESKNCGVDIQDESNFEKVARKIGFSEIEIKKMKQYNFVEKHLSCMNEEDLDNNNILSDEYLQFIDVDEADTKTREYLLFIDKCFKLKKRSEWLKAVITGHLYDDLHRYFNNCSADKITRFSFIDTQIYNLQKTPSQKEIAQIIEKDEAQLTRAKKNFFEQVTKLWIGV